MSLLNHQLELLAPARDADIGIAAIHHGADAVYIGAPAFGARASASNTLQDIERLCKEAHRFNSKIFITLNTILRDDELEAAQKMAWDVYRAGADVLIVQDMAFLQMDLPPIQLHASTQTDIRTPEKAKFMQDVGFSQIVLARELTLPQIKAIHDVLDAERCNLEFFVHGALCVAYSGQCFISHAHTGRSANRGDCSQACRLPYHVTDAEGRFIAHDKHVLSMKDNNQSENLAALVDAGVRSFKIEGRYKDMAYVKNITGHYRVLIDELIEARQYSADPERPPLSRASSGNTTLYFTPNPEQNFNREFTDYFVQGRKEDIGAFDSPKNPGIVLGEVMGTGANWLEVQPYDKAAVLHNGDGLCYYDLQKELVGVAINRAEPSPKKALKKTYGACTPKTPSKAFVTYAQAWSSIATATWIGCVGLRRTRVSDALVHGWSLQKHRKAFRSNSPMKTATQPARPSPAKKNSPKTRCAMTPACANT
jgi:23S rRNA 5-hydroxycytidine C2501 synthase